MEIANTSQSLLKISNYFLFLIFIKLVEIPPSVSYAGEGCSWKKDIRVPANIKSRCQCSKTTTGDGIIVQCHEVELSQLVSVLTEPANVRSLELLYLNSSKVTDGNDELPSRIFKDVKIVSLQMSGCGIKTLHYEAFEGQQSSLKHLSLTMNELKEVPRAALEKLQNLSLLDLSYNKITRVPKNAFVGLTKLSTLKLNDNNLELERDALKGLEVSLKNLNLKGTRASKIPEAIGNLSTLTFLDLAQNRIRELNPIPFTNLHSLTALNLERNLLQTVPKEAFTWINDTLNSLSLLNNLITEFPTDAIEHLHDLRVLDLGFNLFTEIPENAFEGLTALTLLALDGNPLSTLPEKTFACLNNTLRGLSLGGRFLNCDCQIRWIKEWVQKKDLQVTSREKNPQFCGNPPELQRFNFSQLTDDDFQCASYATTTNRKVSPKTSIDERKTAVTRNDAQPATPAHPDSDGHYRKNETRTGNHKIKIKIGSKKNGNKSEQIHDPQQSNIETLIAADDSAPDESVEGLLVSDKSPLYVNLIELAEIGTSTIKPIVQRVSLSSIKNQNQKNVSTKTPQRSPAHGNSAPPKAVISTTSSTSTTISISGRKSSMRSTNPPLLVEKMKGSRPALDLDDSKIPIITGVGPGVVRIPNTGNIVQVRVTPTSTITPSKGLQGIVPTRLLPTNPPNFINSGRSVTPKITLPEDLIFADKSDIEIEKIERNGEAILVQWKSREETGFRVIYRIFGEETFRHGPPLTPNEREYMIQTVPHSECVIICVVPYEEIVYNEISASPNTIPPGNQCRELKPSSPFSLMNRMDKVTIGASAAICFIVILAILIFIGRTTHTKRKSQDSRIMSTIPTCSLPTRRESPPLISKGSIMTKDSDWDQLSGVSTRSIPRVRVQNMTMDAPQIGNGLSRGVLPVPRSHDYHCQHRQMQSVPCGNSSQKSYHALHSHGSKDHHHHGSRTSSAYLNNQSRLLRASLGRITSQRQAAVHKQRRKQGSRKMTPDSRNTLTGYDYETPTPDMTDHEMVPSSYSQNGTRKHELPLF